MEQLKQDIRQLSTDVHKMAIDIEKQKGHITEINTVMALMEQNREASRISLEKNRETERVLYKEFMDKQDAILNKLSQRVVSLEKFRVWITGIAITVGVVAAKIWDRVPTTSIDDIFKP